MRAFTKPYSLTFTFPTTFQLLWTYHIQKSPAASKGAGFHTYVQDRQQ